MKNNGKKFQIKWTPNLKFVHLSWHWTVLPCIKVCLLKQVALEVSTLPGRISAKCVLSPCCLPFLALCNIQFRFMCHASQPKLSYPKSRPCLLFWRSVWTYYSLAAVYNSLRTFPKKSPYDFKIAILSDPNLNINSSYYKSRIHLSAIFGLFLQPFNSKAKTSSPHRVLGTVLETFILHSKLAM